MPDSNLYLRAGVYWLRATIKGVEHRESLRTRDVKAARKLRNKRIEEIVAARHHGERTRPWIEAVTEWAEHAADQLGGNTKTRYAVSLSMVEPYLTTYSIDRIDGKAIATLMEARRKAGASAATIRRDLTAVSRVLDYAKAMGWREGNPTLSKRRLLKERRDPILLPVVWGADPCSVADRMQAKRACPRILEIV
jgi:integrase/recombinase XerD